MDNIIEMLDGNLANSLEKDCVPVSAVVVNNGNVVGVGYNLKEYSKNPIDHAEIIAIQGACKERNDWRLDDCELYVTLRPCLMCASVAKEVRIKKIYYFVDNTNNKNECERVIDTIEFIKLDDKYGFESILKDFFRSMR